MANKKSNLKKSIPEKSTLIIIAEKIGELAGRIANQKDHLVEAAGDAIESIKKVVKHTSNKKPVAKKPVVKAAKKGTKKKSRATHKKSARPATVKKIIKKSVKKVSTKK